MTTSRRTLLSSIVVGTALAVTACAPPSSSGTTSTASSAASGAAVAAKDAKSAADLGGMEALVAAAKKEGALNVIALPPDWANYGEIIKGFTAKYGITDQLRSAGRLEPGRDQRRSSSSRAPTGPRTCSTSAWRSRWPTPTLFAPYQVADVEGHPGRPEGADRSLVPGLRRLHVDRLRLGQGADADLESPTCSSPSTRASRRPQRRPDAGQRRPQRRGDGERSRPAARSTTSAKGIDFFKQLKAAGNFLPVEASTATVKNGTTPVVFDWDYLNAAQVKNVPTWKVFVPGNAVIGGYYAQAINKDGPHPAAARLWAGVPLLRRGPEPLPQGWRPPGPDGPP